MQAWLFGSVLLLTCNVLDVEVCTYFLRTKAHTLHKAQAHHINMEQVTKPEES